MKTLIMIPAYNEQNTLESLIREIEQKCPEADYLVINDCSSDDTLSVLEKIGASYVSAPVNLGIGGAVQTGYKYAYENGYDIAIQVDGDGQHDVAYVRDMVKVIESGEADVVIGSRFIEKEGFQSSGARRAGIRFLSGLIWLMSGTRVKDVTSGYRAVNREYITAFAENYPDDYPEPEVIVVSSLSGARIKEIPVIMRERTDGISSINMKKSVYYMIKVSIAIILCRISLGIRTGNKNKK
ncbi:MAG: glycosyltransferase family 2 protein [Lachnospiraceae bacterium]|nr:glycosyltransferase family 2 protein [Lachnospiraceae bacterium]